MILDMIDWRGGYCTDVPNELLTDNELKIAENCYWDNGLKKRSGIESLATLSGNIVGLTREFIDPDWYTIAAIDLGSGTAFRYGISTITGSINYASGTSYFPTLATNVQFARLGEKIVGVSEYFRPALFYASNSLLMAMNLETYDSRNRASLNWTAGQVDSSGNYTSDTERLQSNGTASFSICSNTGTSGFYTACDFTFSKIAMLGLTAMTGTFTVNYEYWNGTSFTSIISMNNTPDWTATGSTVIEFEIPTGSFGSVLWTPIATNVADLSGKYAARVRFSGNTNVPVANGGQLWHTHYLSQIMARENPHNVATHKNHVFLAAGNQVQISVANKLTDWREDRYEYFFEGGERINAMFSAGDFLAVFKDNAMYGLFGNSWQSWSTKKIALNGSSWVNGGAVGLNVIVFAEKTSASKVTIFLFDGQAMISVSKHIASELSNVKTSVFWVNPHFWIVQGNKMFIFDPDTIRKDLTGDGRVSFYKYTTNVGSDEWPHKLILCTGANDSGMGSRLIIGANGTERLNAFDTASSQDTGAAASAVVSMTAQTRFVDFGKIGVEKNFGRIKLKLADATIGTPYAVELVRADEWGEVAATWGFVAGPGNGFHQEMLNTPHTIDGRNLSVRLTHNATTPALFYGYSIEQNARRY
jgi:hypothetical protein